MPAKNREKWMEIIKSSYPNGEQIPSSDIAVCDLHFKSNDILRHDGIIRCLDTDAMPNLSQWFIKHIIYLLVNFLIETFYTFQGMAMTCLHANVCALIPSFTNKSNQRKK